MKKSTKILIGTAAAAAAAAGTAALLFDVIDNLLVDRKWTVPQGFADKVSGADVSALKEENSKNRNWLEEYGYEKFSITSDNGQKLCAYLVKPEQPSKVFVFCSHGYRSNGRDEYCSITRYYLEKGFNVFMCDHVSSGESEGKYIGFGHFEYDDCLKWLDYLTDTYGDDIEIIVHGISMGAATVMLMSGSEKLSKNVKMIVSDCGYTSAWDEFRYKLHDMGIPEQPLLNIVNSINKKKAGYDFKDTSALESVKKAKVPMLFVHGGGDAFVPTYMVNLVYEACSSPYKDILIVDGADHAQSFLVGKEAYEAKLNEFIDKFIGQKETV
ncbi:MAG: alpha/beta hydrolase [Acutalibacteraceae bacterium]